MTMLSSWVKRQIACGLTALAILPVAGAQQSAPPAPAPTAASAPQQTAPDAPQQNTMPLGTAAAPSVKAEGNPASRPAGAAIAPAKQRRSHKVAIRVALIVGAAIAIGAVAGASLASPSKP